MTITEILFLLLIVLALPVAHTKIDDELVTGGWVTVTDDTDDDDGKSDKSFTKNSFPAGFLFGAATSAYQIEGAAYEDGKGQSIWDKFTEDHPELIKDRSSGKVAADSYHRYKDDVKMAKDMGLSAYRFSIAWTRILPRGKLSEKINEAGVRYYNNLINEIVNQGLTPFVTIFHWDLPQALQDEYGGFLHKNIVDDFRDYARLCFALFGDRVKHWITINEPWSYSVTGYARGAFPPNRCSRRPPNKNGAFLVGRFANVENRKYPTCEEGDSATEPYMVTHNLILAHAAAVKVYKDFYQKFQKGQIGITLNVDWYVPFNDASQEDRDAADRGIIFNYGWFMEPLHIGTYPAVMVKMVGDRLPKFTEAESDLVKGSYDFIGINYYTTRYAIGVPCGTNDLPSYLTDPCVNITNQKNGNCIGQQAASEWLCSYPRGLQEILLRTKYKYNDPIIYITENGFDGWRSYKLNDWMRKRYHQRHLTVLQDVVVNDKVRVKGYFIWSLLDNYEWISGYTVRFGVIYVDYDKGGDYLNRTNKNSCKWLSNFLLPDVQNGRN